MASSGRFHLHDGLAEDFYIDQSNSYEPIDVDTAKRYIAGGLATLSPHKHGHLIRKFDADRSARPVADVLADATPGHPSERSPGSTFAPCRQVGHPLL